MRILYWLATFFKLIRFELLTGLLGLALALGQYFYSSINTRMTIANIWRDGYTADNRNRVAKFRHLYKTWKFSYEHGNGEPDPDETVRRLVYMSLLYDKSFPLKDDKNITELVSDEIALINGRSPTNEDYISATLKYRNAIIESLNTMEAVKAVIEARPLPFFKSIVYPDTLGGRYQDVIIETRRDLKSFINHYREMTKERKTPAWYVLTNEESYAPDYVFAGILLLILLATLILVYVAKRLGITDAPPPKYFIKH